MRTVPNGPERERPRDDRVQLRTASSGLTVRRIGSAVARAAERRTWKMVGVKSFMGLAVALSRKPVDTSRPYISEIACFVRSIGRCWA